MKAQNKIIDFHNKKEVSDIQSNNQNTKQLNLLDGNMVSLINGIIQSIKEYYKVSRSNNSDANKILLYYKEEEQNIQILLNEIINNSQYEKFNELFDKMNTLNKIIAQLQDNTDSCLHNLNLFFEDAKIIFKNIREQKQKQLLENNKNQNNNESTFLRQYNLPPNFQSKFNKFYNQILLSVNKLSDFDYIIEANDSDSADYYNSLQESIKQNLSDLFNLFQQLSKNNNKMMMDSLIIEDPNNSRNKSIKNDISKETQKLKTIIQQKDKKIRELNTLIQKMKKDNLILNTEGNISDYNISNIESNQNSSIMKLKRIIKEKDNQIKSLTNKFQTERLMTEPNSNNNNNNIKKLLTEKNNQIFNLQQQLNIYEQNENIMNNQLDDLNNQFQKKINQYESQIIHLKKDFEKNNNQSSRNNLTNLNNNSQKNTTAKSDFGGNGASQNELGIITNDNKSKINILENKNMNLLKLVKKQKLIINKLEKENVEYKNKIEQYDQINKNQVEEMNNNIYKNNKIIEQKDAIIRQLREKKEAPNSQININMSNQSNNNEIILLKYENEKLKNEIASLRLSKKNNNLMNNNISPQVYNNNFQEIQKLNINLMEENSELKLKITQLEESVQLLTSKNDQQKNLIKNLESEITNKKEQIEGLKVFISKLQLKIDKEDFLPKSNSRSKNTKSETEVQTDQNIAEKMKNLLDLLNKANMDIAALQKKNKELQYKLEEKQLEQDLPGFRTEEVNFSNYEEEFDLKKMISGARDKNRSEDINIDYPGMQEEKEKYKDLQQNMDMLEEQVKILISNINCNNNKIKPQINQICQIMRIPAKNIPLIIAGKNKKKSLGLID